MNRTGWLMVGALGAGLAALAAWWVARPAAQNLRDMLSRLPEGAGVVLIADLTGLERWWMAEMAGHAGSLLEALGADEAIETELKALLQDRHGVSYRRFERLACFVQIAADAMGCVIEGEFTGELKPSSRQVRDVPALALGRHGDTFVALHQGRAYFGSAEGLDMLLAVASGAAEALSNTEAGIHAELLERAKDPLLLLTAESGWLPPPALKAIGGPGVEGLALGLSGRGRWMGAAVGDADGLAALARVVEEGLESMVSLAKAEKERALQGDDTAEAATLVVLHGIARRIRGALRLERQPKSLVIELDAGSSASLLHGAAVLSAVAVPAFVRYIERSKRARPAERELVPSEWNEPLEGLE